MAKKTREDVVDANVVIRRLSSKQQPQSPDHHATLRRASVLILISRDLHILVTQRSKNLRSFPGQSSFPGGKQDDEDEGDDVVTALRETKEEVGLDLKLINDDKNDVKNESSENNDNDNLIHARLICRLRTVESLNHLCVTPIVVFAPHQTADALSLQLKMNADEVECCFWVPLQFFAATSPVDQYDIEWSGETFCYRTYEYSCQAIYHADGDGAGEKGTENKSGKNRANHKQQKTESRTSSFPITGLTAHLAHDASSIAYPQP